MTTIETAKLSLKKDDMVQVIAGRDKGKTGKILRVDAKNNRVVVEKVNLVKRHMKPTQQAPGGGIIEKESSIAYSNILIMCPKCNKGVRHGRKIESAPVKAAKGKKAGEAKSRKVRFCKKCGDTLDLA